MCVVAEVLHGKESPPAWNALQVVLAPIVELDVRADDVVGHRPRHEHLTWSSQVADPARNGHDQTGDVAPTPLDFARVDAGPQF